jgi:glycosyltransferase involved in cell wall biosynthesis
MLVRKLNLESRIIFTGFREDRLSIMASSDVIVHASSSPEPFGLVVTEAMSVAKSVIATDIGAPSEIVVHKKTGILIPPKDADAIASACIRLLKDPGLRNKIGIAGRKRVEEYFTAERMTREIENVLTALVYQKD